MKETGCEVEAVPIPTTYCVLTPTATQQAFLKSEAKEVFFGGAAGGGKSVALLMGALQYVQTPGYAALILRKDFARLELAGGLITRSHEWFGHSKSAKWIASRRQWIFPILGRPELFPATIMFGYLNRPLDKFRYASSEFQYIAFDELTDFTEEDYLFLFSRLRRNTSFQVPLRMRSASNPGGPGHTWVKERFVEGAEVRVQGSAGPRVFEKHGRIYVPSRIEDNPHLDAVAYRESLLHLPLVEREQLLHGDWNIQRDGLIKEAWFRYYVETEESADAPAQMELLEPGGRILATIPDGSCYRFVTIDPAGSSDDCTKEGMGRRASWSVVQVWDQARGELAKFLLLRHQERMRVDYPTLCSMIREVSRQWRAERVFVEGERLGKAIYQTLRDRVPIECVPTGNKKKVERAVPLMMKLSAGEVFLPRNNTTWRPKFEAELLAWTGDERQAADQIDAAAYAAIVAGERKGGAIRVIGPLRS